MLAGADTYCVSEGAEEDFNEPEELEDEDFHQKFMTEIRLKEQLEKIKESRGVNFEEDDDTFIMDFNSQAK